MSLERSYNIALVDDHRLLLEGLETHVKLIKGVSTVYLALNGQQLKSLIGAVVIDLVLLDVNLPGENGIKLTKWLKTEYPHIPVIVYSMYEKPHIINALIRNDVRGYIVKSESPKVVVQAIQTVLAGGNFFSVGILNVLNKTSLDNGAARAPQMTAREIEIIKAVSAGKSTESIATTLSISIHTVGTHRRRILAKIQGKNTADIVRYAFNSGIVSEL